MDELQQFKDSYINERYELLQDMEERLMTLDEGTKDLEELNAIFRCAHSIKGGAGAFGFNRVASFTHTLEALLDRMRDGSLTVSRESIDTLLKSVDVVTQMMKSAQAGESLPEDFGLNISQTLNKICGAPIPQAANDSAPAIAEVSGEEEVKIYTIQFVPHKELLTSGNEPIRLFRELSTLGVLQPHVDTSHVPTLDQIDPTSSYFRWNLELESTKSEQEVKDVFLFVDGDCDLKISILAAFTRATNTTSVQPVPTVAESAPEETVPDPSAAGSAKPEAEAAASSKTPAATSIRVDVDKVDRLVNMVGELVITQAVLSAQTKELPTDKFKELLSAIEELSMHTRELQEAVMSVRMQPVKSIFSRMPRLVRDLSQKLEKNIVLEMSGENTEIDKTVIEQLSDPLTHMIRNSVDHGIELPAARIQKGKPAQGTIHLSANHRGGRIIIEISDDGNGIDRERVLRKAKEKGLVAQDVTPSDEEIDNLIFLPGFSTAEKVSDISGRGVGMDVVRRNIETLGGTASIYNTPGKGSVFSVSLPLTLAILDGMIVKVGNENYIIPINNIIETARPKPEDIKQIADGSDVINMRGEFISVVYLHRLFYIKNAVTKASDGLLVLVENGREKFGLVVDELVGQQQVVIKTLKECAYPVKGISGATILGDGKVSLIVDVAEVAHFAAKPDQIAKRSRESIGV